MKKTLLIFLFLVFISASAQAGEWVLWQNEISPGTNAIIKLPLPLSEHKTLKACQDAAAQNAVNIASWAKKNDTVETDSVQRFIAPDGAFYKYKDGLSIQFEYRCYPFGAVPVQGNFQTKASQ